MSQSTHRHMCVPEHAWAHILERAHRGTHIGADLRRGSVGLEGPVCETRALNPWAGPGSLSAPGPVTVGTW